MDERIAELQHRAARRARQGDVEGALALWEEALVLEEESGDQQGRATTLANMAWAAGRRGDPERARRLNLEAAADLAACRIWPDLIGVLSNLGAPESPEAAGYLAQALWLGLRVRKPLDGIVNAATGLVGRIGPEADAALMVAAAAFALADGSEELRAEAGDLLAACAAARQIPEEEIPDWTRSLGIDAPERLFAELARALEGIVGEEAWLFDRARVG